MILVCEEYCYRHYLASSTEKVAARERFDAAVEEARERDCGVGAAKTLFHTAVPLKWGTYCGGNPPPGVTILVHLHEGVDSTWTDLTQQ